MFKLSPVLFISINWCAVFCLCLLHVVVLFILLLDPDLIFLFCDNLFWVFCFRVCGQVLRIGILKFLGISDYLSGNQNFLVFEIVLICDFLGSQCWLFYGFIICFRAHSLL